MEENGVKVEDNIEVVDIPEEPPMNVFDRQNLLDIQKGTKDEDDILYDKISSMSNEELRKAIDEESTDIKDGDGLVSLPEGYTNEDEARVFNNLMLRDIPDSDAMQIYNVAVKAKADPTYNVLGNLPKNIYENIVTNCRILGVKSIKAMNRYARMLVESLMDEMSLDKECQAFQDELGNAMAFPEIVDFYAEHTRIQMEDNILKVAESATDEDHKKELLAVSKAYTDSYTFERQLELLKDDGFIRKLDKRVKRFQRDCDSFDLVLNRSIIKTVPLKSLLNEIPAVLRVSEDTCKKFIVMLAEVSKNTKPDDKAGVWFMYNSIRNIISLARTGTTKTEFSKQGIEKLRNLFSVLEERCTELTRV